MHYTLNNSIEINLKLYYNINIQIVLATHI